MTKSMIVQAYAGMGPLPGAEERVWRRLDEKLNGRAKKVSVSFGRRRPMLPGLIAAAVLVLVLLAALAARGIIAKPETESETELLPAATPVPEEEVETVFQPQRRELRLINATVDGQSSLRLEEEGTFLARAVLPQDMAVDYWLVDGEQADAGKRSYSMEFDSAGVNQVEAVLREVKAVRCGENAYLQFLDENGAASGAMYGYVCFEFDYIVPTTGQLHAGGVISAYVSPIVPWGQEVDYWVIDGEKLETEKNPCGIFLEDLDCSVEIDVVLRETHKRQELGEELVLRGEAPQAATQQNRPADDLPADLSAPPENPAWEGVVPRDGVPVDPDEPAWDGHIHQWALDESRSWESTCFDYGRHIYVCSECEGEYTVQTDIKEHQYVWSPFGDVHRRVCTRCGQRDFYSPDEKHSWVTENDVTHCTVCGATK